MKVLIFTYVRIRERWRDGELFKTEKVLLRHHYSGDKSDMTDIRKGLLQFNELKELEGVKESSPDEEGVAYKIVVWNEQTTAYVGEVHETPTPGDSF